jgi:pyruvate dehydrogenase E1 component
VATKTPDVGWSQAEVDTLKNIEARVLWLATAIVHHANKVRANTSGVKVGGHQTSSASVASIMCALWFGYLRDRDRVSVKPHASPVLHAINYLLGWLDRSYMERLRDYGGLQSYPSRTKDPDPVDFSTGSVGLGATAPIWASIAQRYLASHFETAMGGRQIAILGDAELDEGACWEAIADPQVAKLSELLWIVDLNRQSLDRVVPDIAANRLVAMFEAAGWHTVTVKYGHRLQNLFGQPGGEELRKRIDSMPNEEYQRLLRSSPDEVRKRLVSKPRARTKLASLIGELEDSELEAAVRDLGGHDLRALAEAYQSTDAISDRPSVVFAYTIKGWSLPTEGHPSNHSVLLTQDQYELLACKLGADIADPWKGFAPDTEEARTCAATASRLTRPEADLNTQINIPQETSRTHRGRASTQQALGRLLVDLSYESGDVARRLVTVSPDVASSTNLGGWINHAGIWALGDRIDQFADDPEMLIRWHETRNGQHLELGIAEVNLVGLLSELGLTWQKHGEPLLPIGTIYDPFVARCLEPWSFGIYSGSQAILVGTPSGVSLAPEGGAHQSVITPSIGLEQPRCVSWEPAFGQDFEWAMLHSLSQLGRSGGVSSYFRLSTRPIDQSLAAVSDDSRARDRRRRQVLAGGYRLRAAAEHGLEAEIALVGMGSPIYEVLGAADVLRTEAGVGCDVICVTSADLLFCAYQAQHGLASCDTAALDELFPPDKPLPIVAVCDAHPHTLSFLGSIRTRPIACLGVSDFGQSGDLDDLYRHYGIDVETIVGAALDLLG